ncbi:MAG: rhomboid family intramembrane serine protease [Solirubrobacterales bacterium]|nr:rhomboid family intramembrane serine protease [Solirubrobacterales bacterium]
MTPTPVGMRCPECARERTQVRRMPALGQTPVATQALIGLNVLAFLVETAAGAPLGGGGTGTVWDHGVLYGPLIHSNHEYWRLVTGGFLHDGLFHLFVNMISLWFVGSALEPAIGRINFLAVYFVSLLAGSFGALWFQPAIPTLGASGAIFGIFGALIIVAHKRGIPIWQSGLGYVLVFNLLFSLTIRGISVGDHLGGLVGGLITGWLIVEVAERRRMAALALVGCAVVGVASVIGALAVAGGHGLTPNGFGLTL